MPRHSSNQLVWGWLLLFEHLTLQSERPLALGFLHFIVTVLTEFLCAVTHFFALSCQSVVTQPLLQGARGRFSPRFADELSVLLRLRYSLKEDTSLVTILSHRSRVLFQIRVSPYGLVFVTTRRRHYE